jgi:hypothetical protein
MKKTRGRKSCATVPCIKKFPVPIKSSQFENAGKWVIHVGGGGVIEKAENYGRIKIYITMGRDDLG